MAAVLPPHSTIFGRLVGLGCLSLGLAACANEAAQLPSTAPVPSSPVLSPLPKPSADPSSFSLGLTRAPSSQQVRASFPAGRADPFAPDAEISLLPGPGDESGAVDEPVVLTSAQIKEMIQDLQVMGVVQVAGRQAIFVTFRGVSGEVYPGQEGGKSTVFLPQGWRLVAIRVDQGRIELASNTIRAFIDI